MAHLSDSDVEGFLAGSLTGDDLRRVTRHLLSGCGDCRVRLQTAVPAEALWSRSKAETDDVYDACIDRARKAVRKLEPRLKKDKERFQHGLDLLHERWFGELTWPERRSFWDMHVEIFLELSFEERYRNPVKMVELARTAQQIADRPERARYGEALHMDLRARASAELGNAWRVNEFFDRAEACLETARSLAEQGTGDPLLAVRIDDFEASLRKAQRRFDEAVALLEQVYRAYLRLGERHLAGRALMSKGMTLELSGKPDEAIRSLQQALRLIDAERDPKLVATTQHSLLKTLVDCGKFQEASRLLLQSGLRQKFADDPLNLLRLRWVEAKILAGHGRLENAEEAFRTVYYGFHQRGLHYVAAVAGLDLAEVLLRQFKHSEAHALSVDLFNTFQERRIDIEAQRALMTFEVVCSIQAATPAIARRIGEFLDQRQHNPRLLFEPLRILYG
jgi:predicted negative regulator of RcsB-dependent stress response